jgi:hypothetical protein
MSDFMLHSEILDAFKGRGWVSRSGELFFDGRGGTLHPHLHMRIRRDATVRRGRDIRMAVHMCAWSDGMQHAGGGGRTMIRDGEPTPLDWRAQVRGCNPAMAEELSWVMSYFTLG